MATIAESLARAFQFHEGGYFPQAEQLYRQILQLDPANAPCHNLLGVLAHQVGQPHQALAYIQEAMRLQPGEADFHSNLGLVHQTLGQLPEAIGCYHEALRLQPDSPLAYNNLGNAFRDQGQRVEAIACYREALRLRPDFAEAHNNLGCALGDQGRLDEAAACYRQALHLRPDFPEAHFHLGNALQQQGERDQAITCYREAIRLRPGYSEAHLNLGNALQDQGQRDQAIACYREGLRFRPDYPDLHNTLGVALRNQGRLDEAMACYQEALRLRPAFPLAHNNLGSALHEQGRFDEALACFREALRLQADFAGAHGNLGLICLLKGGLQQGWLEYVERGQVMGRPLPNLRQPLWSGAPLDGQTILVSTDYGFGDTLQFIRYAPLVRERGGRVLVQCRPELHRLLASCAGTAAVIPEGQSRPAFDVHIPLLRLPGILGTCLDSIPARIPYLDAEPAAVRRWRQELGSGGFKVGIVWHGSIPQEEDRRAASLTLFAPLAHVAGVCLYSLQKGPGLAQLAEAGFPIIDLGSRLDDFADTAAVLKNLDLLVTVDNAVAHCAGALGVPVWVALPFVPDWRWLLDREDSPWYPTMRLLRQKQPGRWLAVFERIAAELRGLRSYGSD